VVDRGCHRLACDPFDVRDLHGRLTRFLAAIPLGIVTSLVVTFALPTRRHYGDGLLVDRSGWFVTGGSATLIWLVDLSTLAWAAAFGYFQHRTRTPLIPMARLVRDRRSD
jgi:hypothetical protein